MIFPALIQMLTNEARRSPDLVTTQCPTNQITEVLDWLFPSVYGIAVLVLLFHLHTSNDGYHIRDELRAIALIWVGGSVLWLVTGLMPASTRVGYYVPSFLWVQITYILSFCVSTVWVWNLCREHGASCLTSTHDIEQDIRRDTVPFPALLKDDMFRRDFTNFLCLQFCVENLFFWEAVQHFHNVSEQEMKAEATTIYEKYLMLGSPFEINIPVTVKKAVEAQVKENVFSDTMFDDAAAQTLKLMELDSYPRFASRPGGPHSSVKMVPASSQKILMRTSNERL